MATEENKIEKSFRDEIHEELEKKYSDTFKDLKEQLSELNKWEYTTRYGCASYTIKRINPSVIGAWKNAATILGFQSKSRPSKEEDAVEGAMDFVVMDKAPKKD